MESNNNRKSSDTRMQRYLKGEGYQPQRKNPGKIRLYERGGILYRPSLVRSEGGVDMVRISTEPILGRNI